MSGNTGIDLKWQSATIYGSGSEIFFAGSTSSFVGKAVAAVLSHWNDDDSDSGLVSAAGSGGAKGSNGVDGGSIVNKYLCIPALKLTLEQLVSGIEKETGRNYECVYVDRENLFEEAEKRLRGGWPDAGMFLMERGVLCDEECNRGFFGAEAEELREMLGLEWEDLRNIIRDVVHEVRHRENGGCGCD